MPLPKHRIDFSDSHDEGGSIAPKEDWTICTRYIVVVVYHVTIVAIGHGLLKKLCLLVLGCVLRTAGSSMICNYSDPLSTLELLN